MYTFRVNYCTTTRTDSNYFHKLNKFISFIFSPRMTWIAIWALSWVLSFWYTATVTRTFGHLKLWICNYFLVVQCRDNFCGLWLRHIKFETFENDIYECFGQEIVNLLTLWLRSTNRRLWYVKIKRFVKFKQLSNYF